MLKILCLTNKLVTEITDDFQKALDYHKKHGADFSIEYREVNIKRNDLVLYALDIKGYDVIAYTFHRVDQPLADYFPRCAMYTLDTSLVYMPIEKLDLMMPDDWLWKSFAHELMHAIFYRLQLKYGVLTHGNAIMDGYYKNLDPDAPDGNFAQSWAILQPYMNMLFPKTTIVKIKREKSTTKETLGVLTATNAGATFTCQTLELPWKQNQKNISCIPTGTYHVSWIYSWGRMKWIYQLDAVPNRTYIQIHSANYFSDLLGCIALGSGREDLNKDGELDVINSRNTIASFQTFMGKKNFTLIIE